MEVRINQNKESVSSGERKKKTRTPDLLFGAFGFGVLGEERGVQGLQGFAFGAEESLSSLLQGPAQHRRQGSQSADGSPARVALNFEAFILQKPEVKPSYCGN